MEDKVYILLKPEVKNYLDILQESLSSSIFNVSSRHYVEDWKKLSLELYKPQLLTSHEFAAGTQTYFWMTNHMFGNNSALFILDVDGCTIQEKLNHLAEFKRNFRKKLNDLCGDSIKLFVNLESVPGIDFSNNRKLIFSAGVETIEYSGVWDDMYFKYIHSPDPILEHLEREMGVIKEFGVTNLENLLSESEWQKMISLKTLNRIK